MQPASKLQNSELFPTLFPPFGSITLRIGDKVNRAHVKRHQLSVKPKGIVGNAVRNRVNVQNER